jgi:hypothetical protein
VSPAEIAAIRRACAEIIANAKQISDDAKNGHSPFDYDNRSGVWLRDLEKNVEAIKIAAAR